VRDQLPNGLRILTERDASCALGEHRGLAGAWIAARATAQSGIAHFVEHMLFKGTATRSAEDIAQTIDSIGGQMDAFTAKEYASYYIKVLDEHLPLAVDVLADIVMNPAFARRGHRSREEGRARGDQDGRGHAGRSRARALHREFLGGPSAGASDPRHRETVESLTQDGLRRLFQRRLPAPNLIVAAVGNVDHARVRDLVARAFERLSFGE
jgi:predicted Zn-dependent peptidase